MNRPKTRSSDADPSSKRGSGAATVTQASGRSILIGLAAVAIFLYAVRLILLPFVLAGVAAYALSPALAWLTGRAGGRRWIVVVACVLAIVIVSGVVMVLVAPTVAHAAIHATDNMQSMVQQLVSGLTHGGPLVLGGKSMSPHDVAALAVSRVTAWLSQSGHGFLLVGWAFSALGGSVLTLVIFTYFIASGDDLGRGIFGIIPPAQRAVCERIWDRAGPVLRRYFIGIACVIVYAWIASYIGLGLFLHLPDAVLLALMSGLFELIPVVGPIAAAVIAGLAAVEAAKGIGAIIAYVIYAIALRLSIDEMVGPLVLGQAGRVNPSVVIFCFLTGGILFGIAGLILSVPVALVVKSALAVLYNETEPDAESGEAK